jgi:hypothetical protein
MDNLVNSAFNQDGNCSLRHDASQWQTWPGELSDPMLWSAQFIDPLQNLHFNAGSMSNVEMPIYTPLPEDI